MPNWTESMQQTFEYYIVDPSTWKDIKKLETVTSCTINRDLEAETLGSATIDITESIGECYIRIYLITIQNGVKEKHPLGTFLAQTPSSKFDGKVKTISMDAYTPLIELKENQPPVGYYIPKGENIMEFVGNLMEEHMRAPIVKTNSDTKLYSDFVADTNDTWLSFLTDLISAAYYSGYCKVSYDSENNVYTATDEIVEPIDGIIVDGAKTSDGRQVFSYSISEEAVLYCEDIPGMLNYEFDLDELSRIVFSPKQDTASLQNVWIYDDGNSSILNADITMDHDLYGIPNVVEVIYSNNGKYLYSKITNDDPNSPTSTVSRGREILYRITNPEMVGNPTQKQLDEYTKNTLKNLSCVEYTVSYMHGYCPVRVRDCVRLDYSRAGLNGIKAKVISQSIKCEAGCQVTEKAVFTKKLWG